jgi:hypothetical protein
LTARKNSPMIPPMKEREKSLGLQFLREFKTTLRETGFKGIAKKYGWKLFLVLFVYYLVRDIILYLALPYLIYQGVTH